MKKKKSKWKMISIIGEADEPIDIKLDEYGRLPKGCYQQSRKSRLKHYINTLGERPIFFGNFKDQPKTTKNKGVADGSSAQISSTLQTCNDIFNDTKTNGQLQNQNFSNHPQNSYLAESDQTKTDGP